MKQLSLVRACCLFAALSTLAFAQPSINKDGVVNGASYAGPASSGANTLIAPGSIFVIFGKGMGPASLVSAAALPLPTSLPDANGTSVKVATGTTTVNAFMVYTSATQVAAILPSNTPVGVANVTVTYAGQTSAPQKISVVPSNFGVFTRNSAGHGPAIVQNFISPTSTPLNGFTTAAQSGQTLILYGTGLGAIAGADSVAPGAVAAGSGAIELNIGGKVLKPVYAGRSPNFPGLDQINFVLDAPPAGCYVPMQVRVGTSVSNVATISTAAGKTFCDSPLGLSESALRKLDDGGTVTLGAVIALRFNFLPGFPVDAAGAVFVQADPEIAFSATMASNAGDLIYPVPVGSCIVYDQITAPPAPLNPLTQYANAKFMHAGTKLTLTGKSNVDVPNDGTNLYEALGISLAGGQWTMTGTGGTDIGAFTAKTTISPLVTWTAPLSGDVTRDNLKFTWTGGGSAPQDVVIVSGSSTIVNLEDPTQDQGKLFTCAAPAGPGSFTVPASITAQLPTAPPASATNAYFGTVGLSQGGGTPFTAPLAKGGNIDGGVFAWTYGDVRTVSFK